EDVAVIALQTLHLDALGPDLVLALDVHQAAAVAVLDELPVELEDVVLVALLGVEVAVGLAGDDDDAALDAEDLAVVFLAVLQDGLEAGQVLAIEEIDEALVVPRGRSGACQEQAGEEASKHEAGANHGGNSLKVLDGRATPLATRPRRKG